MSSNTEDIILDRLRNGDKDSIRILFHSYFQRLYIFALKFVDEAEAKDIVQDCFLGLWNNRAKIQITTSLSAYLFTVVKNGCYKSLLKERKKREAFDSYEFKLKEMELDFYVNSEQSILEFATVDRIKKVVDGLPDTCRAVFQKSRFEGYSNKEIAEFYNISEKAVEKHISKALKRFRDEFEDLP